MSHRKRSDRKSNQKRPNKKQEKRRARSGSSLEYPKKLKTKRRVRSLSSWREEEKKIIPEHEFIPVFINANPAKLPKRAHHVTNFKQFYSSKKWGNTAYDNYSSSWERVAVGKRYKKRSKMWGLRMHGPIYEAKCNSISTFKVTRKAEKNFKKQFQSEMKGSGRTSLPKPGAKFVIPYADYEKRRIDGRSIISAAVQYYQHRKQQETHAPTPRVDGNAIIYSARAKAAVQEGIDMEKTHEHVVQKFLEHQGVWPTPSTEMSNLRYILKKKTYKIARLTTKGRNKLIPPWVMNCATAKEIEDRIAWYQEWAPNTDEYIVILKRKLGYYLIRNLAGGPIFSVPCRGRSLEIFSDPQRDRVLHDMARVNLLTIVQWSSQLPPYVVGYIVDYALGNDCVYLYVFVDIHNIDGMCGSPRNYRLWV